MATSSTSPILDDSVTPKRRLSDHHIEVNPTTLLMVYAEMSKEAPKELIDFVAEHVTQTSLWNGLSTRRHTSMYGHDLGNKTLTDIKLTTRQIAETIRLLNSQRSDGTPMNKPYTQTTLELCLKQATFLIAPNTSNNTTENSDTQQHTKTANKHTKTRPTSYQL